MKKLLSTKCSDTSFTIGTLLLRLAMGGLMIPHGYSKLVKFASLKNEFMNFMGLGSTVSLALVIFAEFFCAALILGGLFTRLAAIPLIITMGVAVVKAHHSDVFGEAEHATLYLMGCLAILFLGPGKASLDRLLGK